MTQPIARPAAVVLATAEDDPTRSAYPAALQINALLAIAGYDVAALLPFAPTSTDENLNPHLATALTNHLIATGATAYSVGYLSAHGALARFPDPSNSSTVEEIECGLWPGPVPRDPNDPNRIGVPPRTFMAFGPRDTQHPLGHFFESATLVITACLGTGQLPELLVRRPEQVCAVIGFLRVFIPVSAQMCQVHLTATRATAVWGMYLQAVTEPINALAAGQTATEAFNRTHTHWSELVRELDRLATYPNEDPHGFLRQAVFTNLQNLRVWFPTAPAPAQSV